MKKILLLTKSQLLEICDVKQMKPLIWKRYIWVRLCMCIALKWTYWYVTFAEEQQLLPQIRVMRKLYMPKHSMIIAHVEESQSQQTEPSMCILFNFGDEPPCY